MRGLMSYKAIERTFSAMLRIPRAAVRSLLSLFLSDFKQQERAGEVNSRYSPRQYFLVEAFHRDYQGFRTLEECARQTSMSIEDCARIKQVLYKERLLGNYFFQAGCPPQKFMRSKIQEELLSVNIHSNILEVGPGEHPLFPPEEYPNWSGCDPNYDGEGITFRGQRWAQGRYSPFDMRSGAWETLTETFPEKQGSFDLVVGSHSYEHSCRPVTALRQAFNMLKLGGWIVFFVPDGFSDDPSNHDLTHTIYVVPGMLEDFFKFAGGFEKPRIEPFRPNADLLVLARKKDSCGGDAK